MDQVDPDFVSDNLNDVESVELKMEEQTIELGPDETIN